MLFVEHKTLYRISGALWLLIGIFLLRTGIYHMLSGWDGRAFSTENYSFFFTWLATTFSSKENAAAIMIALSILLGTLKGRIALAKAAVRNKKRIAALENPISIKNLFTKQMYLLILAMMGLGLLLKNLHLSSDIRGFIDIAVGTALIKGAIGYFKPVQKEAKS